MKNFILILIASLFFFSSGCDAQPKSNYEIYSDNVSTAAKYHFFLEKKSEAPYRLTQDMDFYSVLDLKIGESTSPAFTVLLNNDASEYTVGVVAENIAGYYSGMGIATGIVGSVPAAPGGVGFRKK
jgi:hypothetical protein